MKGYHIGFMDSESNGSEDITQLTPGRSTGYFGGPGIYFTLSDPDLDYKKRWVDDGKNKAKVYEIDLDNYNLCKGSLRLHGFLKDFTSLVYVYGRTKEDFDKWENALYVSKRMTDYSLNLKDDRNHPFESIALNLKGLDPEEDSFYFEEYEKDFDRLVSYLDFPKETIEKIYKITFVDNDREAAKYWDRNYKVSENPYDLKRLKSHVSHEALMCGFNESKVFEIANDIYEELIDYYDEDGYLRTSLEDSLEGQPSVPARFIMHMGYDGIVPNHETDNYTYGGVIYSCCLKKQDVKQIDVLHERVSVKFEHNDIESYSDVKAIKMDLASAMGRGLKGCYSFKIRKNRIITKWTNLVNQDVSEEDLAIMIEENSDILSKYFKEFSVERLEDSLKIELIK